MYRRTTGLTQWKRILASYHFVRGTIQLGLDFIQHPLGHLIFRTFLI